MPKNSPEKDLIISTRKQLEILYKELIRSIFSENKECIDHLLCEYIAKADSIKAGGAIEIMLTRIMEKLADYCDDQFSLAQQSYLIAKKKGREDNKKEEKLLSIFPVPSSYKAQDLAGAKKTAMPPTPFMQRVASGHQPAEKLDPGKPKSPTRGGFNNNGPVIILRDPLKDNK